MKKHYSFICILLLIKKKIYILIYGYLFKFKNHVINY